MACGPLDSAIEWDADLKVFGEGPNQQILDDLSHFKQILETGETATVTGQISGRCDQVEQERDGRMRRSKDLVQEASERIVTDVG